MHIGHRLCRLSMTFIQYSGFGTYRCRCRWMMWYQFGAGIIGSRFGWFSLASFMHPFLYLCFQRFANECLDDFVHISFGCVPVLLVEKALRDLLVSGTTPWASFSETASALSDLQQPSFWKYFFLIPDGCGAQAYYPTALLSSSPAFRWLDVTFLVSFCHFVRIWASVRW